MAGKTNGRTTTDRSQEARSGPKGRIRVLVVEDRPVARKLLIDELAEALDIDVVGEARNGQQAVDLARETDPDIILMDLVMPGKDGLATTQEIRGFSDVPVILLTGASIDLESLQYVAKKQGVDAFFQKPSGSVSVDLYAIRDELVAKIRELAKRPRER